MINAILGTKQEMSQTFIEDKRVAVSVIKAGPCIVTHIKSDEKDGYWAVQLGFGEKRTKNITKPMQGHLKGAIKDNKAPRFLGEVRFEKEPEFKVGDFMKVSDIFKKGDIVAVTGVSKGKGFAGVVKRWNFAGGPRTHGQSDRQRAPGSIGQGTTPGRVYKGKKMAGRMGGQRVTVKNLQVISIDEENNNIFLSGPVPGSMGSLLKVMRISAGKLSDLATEGDQPQIKQVEEAEEEVEKEKNNE